ncbi:MAG: Hsp20/alpha crystallin family protein [Bacteroidales bacterium]|nr:Hsp20/alpha crystallin family protein [Candidatus Sodaliphilus fimicaballi]
MLVTRNSQNWLPAVFNEMFDNDFMLPRTMARTAPAINVIESKDAYTVELAAPGMSKDDFKVTLNEDENLVIEIKKKAEKTQENKDQSRYLRREFSYTKFHQTLLLPEDVNREAIAATVENGVLTVALPKFLPEEQKREAKQITIQ